MVHVAGLQLSLCAGCLMLKIEKNTLLTDFRNILQDIPSLDKTKPKPKQ
jgi:hypothetical protein